MSIEFKYIETEKNGRIRKEIVIKNLPTSADLNRLINNFVQATKFGLPTDDAIQKLQEATNEKETSDTISHEVPKTFSKPIEDILKEDHAKPNEKKKEERGRPRAVPLLGSDRTLSNSFAEKLEEARIAAGTSFAKNEVVYSKLNCEICQHDGRVEVIVGFRWTNCPGCGNRLFNEKASSTWHQPDFDGNTYLAQEPYLTPEERYYKRQLEKESAQ